jgi:hypothetical protein
MHPLSYVTGRVKVLYHMKWKVSGLSETRDDWHNLFFNIWAYLISFTMCPKMIVSKTLVDFIPHQTLTFSWPWDFSTHLYRYGFLPNNGRCVFLLFVKWKLISLYLFFILWHLIGSNSNMLCKTVNKTALRIVIPRTVFIIVCENLVCYCDEVLRKLIHFSLGVGKISVHLGWCLVLCYSWSYKSKKYQWSPFLCDWKVVLQTVLFPWCEDKSFFIICTV